MTKNETSSRHQWSVVVPQTSTKDHGDIRRFGDPTRHPELGFEGCRTLYEAFRRGQQLNPLGACLGFRASSTNGMATPYIYSSYTEILARVNAFAAGLDTLNLVPPTQEKESMTLIGLYMKNCMEWFIAEQAIFCVSGATVPFYDTLGPESVEFILKQTSTKTVVATRSELERLCTVKKSGKCPFFEVVVLADGVTTDATKMAKQAGLQIMSFAKVEAVGAQRIATEGHKHRPPCGKDVFTFCYTSGTTGDPKGALLTHENLISAIAGVTNVFPLETTDRHLSYLPLAHIFERVIMCQIYVQGASIAFFRGDPLLLIEDMQACRPTILPAAPRVLNKIYDKIQVGIATAGGMKKKLFDAAVAAKTRNLIAKGQLKHGFYDKLIFSKIKKGLGMDCLRMMVSGSAPLSKTVMNFYRIMLGCPVIEGYGQTEGSAATCVSMLDDMSTAGHVGPPQPAVEIVLADVPDMGYLHTDTSHKGQPCQGRGEIWVRGPTVFKGYYKQPEKTTETVDKEGWLHSGDIGLWTVDGNLQIIDRKKNIFKLSQGEYVAPEKIENIVIQSLLVGQAFVHGDSLQTYLVAIIVPDEEAVRRVLEESGESALAKASFAEICQSEKLKKVIEGEIIRLGKVNGLHGFEIPGALHLSEELFSVENDLLTPTFKLKRHQARIKYDRVIEEMYASLAKPISKL
ncbi:long-chain acyl-CoA synthetase [Nitzschia inconspicua]|uniref:Long-chain-fatty-acid--CoA ligase n=1 Tax=Nitzschia inconspicua TaxID=303405 RepID=A0A9K3LSR5_9STRA|nr:long-chain acyl-CoA synthetase [Nitzschia inconspicua]